MKRPAQKTCGSVARGLRQGPLVTTTRTCHNFDSESRACVVSMRIRMVLLWLRVDTSINVAQLLGAWMPVDAPTPAWVSTAPSGTAGQSTRAKGTRRTGVWETGRQESACVGRCAELHCGRAEQPGPHSKSPTTLTRTHKTRRNKLHCNST